jgi:two-component system response regulator DesR
VIRIVLAKKPALLRGALATALSLESDFLVVCELDTVGGLPVAMQAGRADVAVADLQLLRAEALDDWPGPDRLVLLAGRHEAGALQRAIRAGVLGAVAKEAALCQLPFAVRTVAKGNRFIDPDLAATALVTPESPLTRREFEVLRLAAQGAVPVEIADKLFLSNRTVHNYLSAAVRKTGARTRVEAIRMAEQNGWL